MHGSGGRAGGFSAADSTSKLSPTAPAHRVVGQEGVTIVAVVANHGWRAGAAPQDSATRALSQRGRESESLRFSRPPPPPTSLTLPFFFLQRPNAPPLSPSRETMEERKAVIKAADMTDEMQQDAVDCAVQVREGGSGGGRRCRCFCPMRAVLEKKSGGGGRARAGRGRAHVIVGTLPTESEGPGLGPGAAVEGAGGRVWPSRAESKKEGWPRPRPRRSPRLPPAERTRLTPLPFSRAASHRPGHRQVHHREGHRHLCQEGV